MSEASRLESFRVGALQRHPAYLPPVPQADVALLPLDGSKPFSTSRSHSMPRYGMEVNFLQRRYRYM